jgi:hypothetical protein
MPPELRVVAGGSEVDGTFEMSAVLSPRRRGTGAEAGWSPLGDVAGRLEVTHVGPSALDRLLMSLDPKAANPSILQARAALAMAKPVRAKAVLEHGFLSLNVEVEGPAPGMTVEYSIPRFSVAELLASERLSALLRRAAPALRALDALDTERLEVGQDGSVRMQ